MSRASPRPMNRDYQRRDFDRSAIERRDLQQRDFTRGDANRFLNDSARNYRDLNPSTNRFNRSDFGNQVRRDVGNNRPAMRNAFNNNFWDRHNFRPNYWGEGYNGWAWATTAGVASWLGWNAAPVYYDYYDSMPTYYEPPQQYATSPQYPQSAPQAGGTPSGGDWMSLGVFALSRDAANPSTPKMYLQLALNRQGTVSGTFYNALTDQTYAVGGSIDQSTQRVALQGGDSQSPILETGLYNLTQSEAPAQIHFADGRVQSMTLVRLASQ